MMRHHKTWHLILKRLKGCIQTTPPPKSKRTYSKPDAKKCYERFVAAAGVLSSSLPSVAGSRTMARVWSILLAP